MTNRTDLFRPLAIVFAAIMSLGVARVSVAVPVLHYSVNDTDAGSVAGGVVPSVGSPAARSPLVASV